MKENRDEAGRAPILDPGPEGPAVGMATGQDPAQGAQAKGPEGGIAAETTGGGRGGASIFGPDGAGQFIRLGPGSGHDQDTKHPKASPQQEGSPNTKPGRTTPRTSAAAFTPPKKQPGNGHGGPTAQAPAPGIAAAAAGAIPRYPPPAGQPPARALLGGQPKALLEAKTVERLRRRLFERLEAGGRRARPVPEAAKRDRGRATWTQAVTETILAIQAFQGTLPSTLPAGKAAKIKPRDPRTLSRNEKGRVIAYFTFDQPDVPNQAIADLLAMTPSNVSWRRNKIIEGAARPEIYQTGPWRAASKLALRKEHLQRKAIGKEDYGLAWRIECDYIEKLQELGLIPKQPIQIETKSESLNFSVQVREFIHAFGAIPTPAEFLAALHKPGGGNGNGNGNGNGDGGHAPGILEGPPFRVDPAGDAGGPSADRDPNRR